MFGITTLILASVFFTLTLTLDPPLFEEQVATLAEVVFESFFAIEILLRVAVSPSRIMWFFNAYNIVDVISVLPLFVRIVVGTKVGNASTTFLHQFLLCGVPLLRLCKTLRRFEKFHLLVSAFWLAAEALPFLLFTLFVITLAFSLLIYVIEPRHNIPSVPRAAWFTLVTMTTVGYGDVTPVSAPGQLTVGVLVIFGLLYMSMPIGIIGSAFNHVWERRDRLLLIKRTRDCLVASGFTGSDMTAMLRFYDRNGDGELDVREFRDMLRKMRVGLSDERIIELFQTFDSDGGGTIDYNEFIRGLFPTLSHQLMMHKSDEADSGKELIKDDTNGDNETNDGSSHKSESQK